MADATIQAVVQGLRWAADGIESGRLMIIKVEHEREVKEDAMIGIVDTTIRKFHLRYKVIEGPLSIGAKDNANERPEDSLRRVPFI